MPAFDKLRARARSRPVRVVLPEGTEERVLQAAAKAAKERIAKVVLLGDEAEVEWEAKKVGARLEGAEILDHRNCAQGERYAEALYQRRKHKGMTREDAASLIDDPVYFAAVMVHVGDAEAYVGGASLPTARVLRPALQIIGPAEGVAAVSSFVPIDTRNPKFGDEGLLAVADAGVIPDPSAEQMADIAISTAASYRMLFEREPRIAFLSYSTKGSARHPLVEKVVRATELARERAPELLMDGELQADSALVPEVARRKCPDSPLGGKANILIAPDLNVGNICYKLMQRMSGGSALGPLIQGLRKPANDLSRGCVPEEIVDVIAAAAVRAAEEAKA